MWNHCSWVIYTMELNPYSMSWLIPYLSMLKTMMSKKVSMHLITLKICFNLQKNHGEKSTQRAQFTLLSFIIRCISICLWRNLLNTINFFFNFSKDFLTKLELIWSILKKVHWVFLSLVIRFCTVVILLNCQKKKLLSFT